MSDLVGNPEDRFSRHKKTYFLHMYTTKTQDSQNINFGNTSDRFSRGESLIIIIILISVIIIIIILTCIIFIVIILLFKL